MIQTISYIHLFSCKYLPCFLLLISLSLTLVSGVLFDATLNSCKAFISNFDNTCDETVAAGAYTALVAEPHICMNVANCYIDYQVPATETSPANCTH